MKEEILNDNMEISTLESKNYNSRINFKNIFISTTSIIFIVFLVISCFNSNQSYNEKTIRMLAEKAESLVPDGYASLNGGTTGGKGGKTVTVKKFKDLKEAAESTDPMIIIVEGTIKTTDGGDKSLNVRSNKTLMGKDKNAKIYGGISISKEKNVIVYNLNIEGFILIMGQLMV